MEEAARLFTTGVSLVRTAYVIFCVAVITLCWFLTVTGIRAGRDTICGASERSPEIIQLARQVLGPHG